MERMADLASTAEDRLSSLLVRIQSANWPRCSSGSQATSGRCHQLWSIFLLGPSASEHTALCKWTCSTNHCHSYSLSHRHVLETIKTTASLSGVTGGTQAKRGEMWLSLWTVVNRITTTDVSFRLRSICFQLVWCLPYLFALNGKSGEMINNRPGALINEGTIKV